MSPFDTPVSPEQAYELAQLHARAMLALENANWPLGQERDVWVGSRHLSRKERRSRGTKDKVEKIYIREHAITVFAARLMTRSGACYQARLQGSPSGMTTTGRNELVAWATVTVDDAYYWIRAFDDVISQFETPKAIPTRGDSWPLALDASVTVCDAFVEPTNEQLANAR